MFGLAESFTKYEDHYGEQKQHIRTMPWFHASSHQWHFRAHGGLPHSNVRLELVRWQTVRIRDSSKDWHLHHLGCHDLSCCLDHVQLAILQAPQQVKASKHATNLGVTSLLSAHTGQGYTSLLPTALLDQYPFLLAV